MMQITTAGPFWNLATTKEEPSRQEIFGAGCRNRCLPTNAMQGERNMNNGDYIRSMTDEDITENLTPGICDLIQHRDPQRCQTREHCFHCVKDWLKEENTILVRADQWKI